MGVGWGQLHKLGCYNVQLPGGWLGLNASAYQWPNPKSEGSKKKSYIHINTCTHVCLFVCSLAYLFNILCLSLNFLKGEPKKGLPAGHLLGSVPDPREQAWETEQGNRAGKPKQRCIIQPVMLQASGALSCWNLPRSLLWHPQNWLPGGQRGTYFSKSPATIGHKDPTPPQSTLGGLCECRAAPTSGKLQGWKQELRGEGSGPGILELCLWEAGQSWVDLVSIAMAGVQGEAKRNDEE